MDRLKGRRNICNANTTKNRTVADLLFQTKEASEQVELSEIKRYVT